METLPSISYYVMDPCLAVSRVMNKDNADKFGLPMPNTDPVYGLASNTEKYVKGVGGTLPQLIWVRNKINPRLQNEPWPIRPTTFSNEYFTNQYIDELLNNFDQRKGTYNIPLLTLIQTMIPLLNLLRSDGFASQEEELFQRRVEYKTSDPRDGSKYVDVVGRENLVYIQKKIRSSEYATLNNTGKQFFIPEKDLYKERYITGEDYAGLTIPPKGTFTQLTPPEPTSRTIKVRGFSSSIPRNCQRCLVRLRDGSPMEMYTTNPTIFESFVLSTFYDILNDIAYTEPSFIKRWYFAPGLTVELGRPAYRIEEVINVVRQAGLVRLGL